MLIFNPFLNNNLRQRNIIYLEMLKDKKYDDIQRRNCIDMKELCQYYLEKANNIVQNILTTTEKNIEILILFYVCLTLKTVIQKGFLEQYLNLRLQRHIMFGFLEVNICISLCDSNTRMTDNSFLQSYNGLLLTFSFQKSHSYP